MQATQAKSARRFGGSSREKPAPGLGAAALAAVCSLASFSAASALLRSFQIHNDAPVTTLRLGHGERFSQVRAADDLEDPHARGSIGQKPDLTRVVAGSAVVANVQAIVVVGVVADVPVGTAGFGEVED